MFLFKEEPAEKNLYLNLIKLFQGFPVLPEKYSLFIPTYKQSAKFMNQEKANVSKVSSFKDFETQTGVNNIEK